MTTATNRTARRLQRRRRLRRALAERIAMTTDRTLVPPTVVGDASTAPYGRTATHQPMSSAELTANAVDELYRSVLTARRRARQTVGGGDASLRPLHCPPGTR